MIIGTGVDIIEVRRLRQAIEKWGRSFLERVFTGEELENAKNRTSPYQHLAGRFAAKEAVFKALDNGIDGVLVLGCHIGDCHYLTGNHRTAKRMIVLEKLLGHMGVNPKRLRIDWISASEGEKFQRTITEFTEQIRKLGPANGGSHGRSG